MLSFAQIKAHCHIHIYIQIKISPLACTLCECPLIRREVSHKKLSKFKFFKYPNCMHSVKMPQSPQAAHSFLPKIVTVRGSRKISLDSSVVINLCRIYRKSQKIFPKTNSSYFGLSTNSS